MKFSRGLRLLICFFIFAIGIEAILVCKSFDDYYQPTDETCFDNPDGEQNLTQIIRRWGYSAEEHYLMTEDGYELLLVHCYNKINQTSPVLLAHGIITNGISYAVTGNKSFAHTLATSGYDVWIINFRGTIYSSGHANLSTSTLEYWDFGLLEMAQYDMKTTVDYVFQKTHKKIIIICYSMSTQLTTIYSHLYNQDLEEKVQAMVYLAPTLFPDDVTSWFMIILDMVPYIWPISDTLFGGQIWQLIPILSSFCNLHIDITMLCQSVLGKFYGYDYEQLDPITLPILMAQAVDTMCSKVLENGRQQARSGQVQYYDYGEKENMIRYGQSTPPFINLSRITVPLSLWAGPNDPISTINSTTKICNRLIPDARCKVNVIEFDKWNHIDFMYAKDIDLYLFSRLLPELERLQKGTC